ncbi:hypothetical protein [Caulobacter sp. RL271]|uniref:Lipoprotein n=1 Tax=Caulobacter segnis TaxID=88688 RepID=A0ABY4ZX13_9CAUL|nr:hypothetical protein [Caulobacter segnis]USQ97275.1 hypothetical protein MZV50_06950 [Caulobacter segnis]
MKNLPGAEMGNDETLAPKRDLKTNLLGCGAVLLFALVALVGCNGCADYLSTHSPPSSEPPKSLQDELAEVRLVDKVEIRDVTVTVRLYLPAGTASEASFLDHAADAVRSEGKIIKARSKDLPATVKSVDFLVDTDVVDRLGNDRREKVMSFALRADDMKAANYDGLYGSDLLNIVHEGGVSSGAGRRIVEAWCAKPDNADRGGAFCAEMLGG